MIYIFFTRADQFSDLARNQATLAILALNTNLKNRFIVFKQYFMHTIPTQNRKSG